MTALLESPVGTLDVSLLEERQPDVPLTCTYRMFVNGVPEDPECRRKANWEAMCMGCGRVLRACDPHMADVWEKASWLYNDIPPGAGFKCKVCKAPIFPEQYARIGA